MQQAIPIAKKIGAKKLQVVLYYDMSYFYNKLNQPENALRYDNQANELVEQLHDDRLSDRVFCAWAKSDHCG